jgi:hypothetical protein
MQRNTIVIPACSVSLTALCCLCCLAAGLWWDGYYLPYKPCRPVTYSPNTEVGSGEGMWFLESTSDSLNVVLANYDQRLKPHIVPDYGDTGQWSKEQLPDGRYLYSCFGVDINRLSTETGCIYVKGQATQTQIEGWLFRSEGGNWPCPKGNIP